MKNLQQSLIQVCALLLALPMLVVNSIAQANDFPTAAPEDVGVSSERPQRLSSRTSAFHPNGYSASLAVCNAISIAICLRGQSL